jgi:cytoskeletal protein CcmA (bactofilin family)
MEHAMFGNKPSRPMSIETPATPIECLIGARMSVVGDITFSGGLNIAGSIKGTVAAEGNDGLIVLNESGRIEGDLRAPNVRIDGEMVGDVVATEKLILGPTARVRGNVYYKLLEMTAGSQVNGQMVHQDEPMKQLAKLD